MLRIDLDSSLAAVHHLSLAWYSRLGTNYIWRLAANTGIRGLTHVMSPGVSRVSGGWKQRNKQFVLIAESHLDPGSRNK